MNKALEQANKALILDEVPIGAIITYRGKIIATGYNKRNTNKNSTSHAELIAISEACNKLGDWRLEECSIYITLEPCPMCAGAIVQARVSTVVYGAPSPKSGFGGSVINILEMDTLNHRCEVIRNIKKDECSRLLKNYFIQMRKKSLNSSKVVV